MTYQVRLEVFEGPFDLLLHLISRRRVDIYDVDLAEITADFLASLRGIDELDLDTATRFLVVAATLVELKAARLLPTDERDELEDLLGEARDLLYARLLEYRAFRDVARLIEPRLRQGERRFAREVPLEPRFRQLVPETPLPIDSAGLQRLAAMVTARGGPEHVDLSHIRKTYISIRDAARELLGRLPEDGSSAAFRELVEGHPRGDRVVYFLALLELYKLGHLGLDQSDHHGPLRVERRLGAIDLDALTDDYTGGPAEPDADVDADAGAPASISSGGA